MFCTDVRTPFYSTYLFHRTEQRRLLSGQASLFVQAHMRKFREGGKSMVPVTGLIPLYDDETDTALRSAGAQSGGSGGKHTGGNHAGFCGRLQMM